MTERGLVCMRLQLCMHVSIIKCHFACNKITVIIYHSPSQSESTNYLLHDIVEHDTVYYLFLTVY